MLEDFFESRFRIQEIRSVPRGRLLERFAEELRQMGYAELTARRHIRAAEHFVYWTNQKGLVTEFLQEGCVESFDRHLCRCQCPHFGHTNRGELRKSVRQFLKFLRRIGGATGAITTETPPEPILLRGFRAWMRQQRGTFDSTLYNYGLAIRDLLKALGEDPSSYDAQGLRKFILKCNQHCGWAKAKKTVTAIRAFIRFLAVEGKCSASLEAAIPTLAHWRLASLPCYLQPEEVERVIAACDREAKVSRRDRAILLLLARLGLRAGDIVQLRLGDINWEQAWISVSGKGRRRTELPLTQEVGDAIAAYLESDRPAVNTDRLFLCSRAPLRAFTSHCTVSMLVRQAMRRAGVTCRNRGAAHVFRHSAATSMLQRGASLQEIANLLRHRSIQTTEIYAKVDIAALRQIAQPWPEVTPC